MTRTEAFKKRPMLHSLGEGIKIDDFIGKIYNEFEKELEELENRSCESCKHSSLYVGTNRKWCDISVKEHLSMSTNDKYFYCNKWEEKNSFTKITYKTKDSNDKY